MKNIKLISADDIFSDLEDIDLVYRAIDEKISNLGGAIYDLKDRRLRILAYGDCLEFINRKNDEFQSTNDKIDGLVTELRAYEKILSRMVEYEKVRKQMEVKKDD